MKFKEYPVFKRNELQNKYIRLPKEDKKLIDDFLSYVQITSKDRTRHENNKRTLTQFRFLTGKSLAETTLTDLREWLALLNHSNRTNTSQNDVKYTMKRFLRWHFKDWSKRFDELKDIKLHMGINEEKINASIILNKEDVEKITKAEPKLFWKAFFITLYESGLRPNELRNLQWKDIKFNVDGDISEINIFATKTHKARSVFIKEATFYLKRLSEENKHNNPLCFPSIRDNNKPMDKSAPCIWLKRISKRVLGREVYPYILRHSRATELYTNANLSDKIAQKVLGHSKSMADVYTHLSSKSVKEALGKTIYKLEELPPEKKHELEERIAFQEKQINKLKEDFSMFMEQLQKGNVAINFSPISNPPFTIVGPKTFKEAMKK